MCFIANTYAALVILHEWTHLGFTTKTNDNDVPEDIYSLDECSTRSVGYTKTFWQSKVPSFSIKNANSYALFAVSLSPISVRLESEN